ncbi:MAG: hypothetical protein LBL09_02510 [Oscillospiraceae bacterium]|jgi:NRPS condensation-like uncharacterized protein|nr:hypothetical protein [Oscillospiraceae bacterium]
MNNDWKKLDNAAKIFPSSIHHTDTHVFRFVCELNEPVDAEVLQSAFEATLDEFDSYNVILKRGVFWYYLEPADLSPEVYMESSKICAGIYNKQEKNLLLSVTYFKCRINLEIFHVLTDGTGALNFLRMLITKYLSKKHKIDEPPLDFDASKTQMQDDSFLKYYSGESLFRMKAKKLRPAAQLQGFRYWEERLRVITGTMRTSDVLRLAHEHNTTLTIYLCACLYTAIANVMSTRDRKKPVVLCVPVNLRKYFPSESVRNFFATTYVPYNFSQRDGSFSDIVASVSNAFKDNLTEENLGFILNNYSAAENNIIAKIAPLKIKDAYLRRAYMKNIKNSTATLSNVGVVKMPPELEKYIRSFDVLSATEKLHVCLCSYNDTLSISFTTPFRSSDVERNFFRIFTGAGVRVEIASNDLDEQEED